jgi:hypothetical protein
MLLGFASGPIGIGLTLIADSMFHPSSEIVAVVSFAIVPFGCFIFSCVTRAKVPVTAQSSARWCATLGIIAPIVWVMLGFTCLSGIAQD